MPGVTIFGNPPRGRKPKVPPAVLYTVIESKSVRRGIEANGFGHYVNFVLGSVKRRVRGATGPNTAQNMVIVGYYVMASEDGHKPEVKEFDSLSGAQRLYRQAVAFEHNPKRRVAKKGTRRAPRKNPPSAGRIISKRVLEIRYKHNDDGKWYKHSFKPGTCAALLENGTVVLYQQDGKPVARDF